MNYSQQQKLANIHNSIVFFAEGLMHLMAMIGGFIGRTVLIIVLSIANGYLGSLAFADFFLKRFVNIAIGAGAKGEAINTMAHSKAHFSGMFVMIVLDIAIYMAGIAQKARHDNKEFDLEPWSLGLAVFSATLGAAGFIHAIALDGSVFKFNFDNTMMIVFGCLFSSAAPLMLFIFTKYQKIADADALIPLMDGLKQAVVKSIMDRFK